MEHMPALQRLGRGVGLRLPAGQEVRRSQDGGEPAAVPGVERDEQGEDAGGERNPKEGRTVVVELYTSRWQNRALETAPFVAVGISRGAPKFRVGYRYRRLPDLYPDGWMLSIEDDAHFEKV